MKIFLRDMTPISDGEKLQFAIGSEIVEYWMSNLPGDATLEQFDMYDVKGHSDPIIVSEATLGRADYGPTTWYTHSIFPIFLHDSHYIFTRRWRSPTIRYGFEEDVLSFGPWRYTLTRFDIGGVGSMNRIRCEYAEQMEDKSGKIQLTFNESMLR